MAIFPTFFFLGNTGKENIFDHILEGKNAIVGYKNKFKKSKNWHLSKVVNPWFWSKNCHFSNLFFMEYRPGKCLWRYSKAKKTLSYALKIRSLKSRKIDIFPKGLTHGFGPKLPFFQLFFFRQYRPGKCLWLYSRAKKLLCRL